MAIAADPMAALIMTANSAVPMVDPITMASSAVPKADPVIITTVSSADTTQK